MILKCLAISGVASYTGRVEQGPVPLGIQIADVAGGSLHALTGILAAVIERSQSGLGKQLIRYCFYAKWHGESRVLGWKNRT